MGMGAGGVVSPFGGFSGGGLGGGITLLVLVEGSSEIDESCGIAGTTELDGDGSGVGASSERVVTTGSPVVRLTEAAVSAKAGATTFAVVHEARVSVSVRWDFLASAVSRPGMADLMLESPASRTTVEMVISTLFVSSLLHVAVPVAEVSAGPSVCHVTPAASLSNT